MKTRHVIGAALGGAGMLLLTAGAFAGGRVQVGGPIVQSARPADQPIVIHVPRDQGRSVVLNPDPTPGGVGQIAGGAASGDWVPGSPLPYGAHPADANALIFVRTREPLPPIAISPWEKVTEEHVRELVRTRPWIRRTDSILHDLRQAQAQWLREHGYTSKPRTIVGSGEGRAEFVTIGVGSGVRVLSPDTPGAKEVVARAAKAPTPETLGMNRDSRIIVRRGQ